MHRVAVRSAARQVLGRRAAPRRFASTASPADRPRSWKSSALRWGLAVSAVYYYNTSSVFADEATGMSPPPRGARGGCRQTGRGADGPAAQQDMVPAPSAFSDAHLPTVDAVIQEKRKQVRDKVQEGGGGGGDNDDAAAKSTAKPTAPAGAAPVPAGQGKAANQQPESEASQGAAALEGGPAALEDEAGQEGAFNPETGEINWDCPCLGGMAHGPCGMQFREAFSCFVFSEADPKGIDCVEKFKAMQECFREHPDVYGDGGSPLSRLGSGGLVERLGLPRRYHEGRRGRRVRAGCGARSGRRGALGRVAAHRPCCLRTCALLRRSKEQASKGDFFLYTFSLDQKYMSAHVANVILHTTPTLLFIAISSLVASWLCPSLCEC